MPRKLSCPFAPLRLTLKKISFTHAGPTCGILLLKMKLCYIFQFFICMERHKKLKYKESSHFAGVLSLS